MTRAKEMAQAHSLKEAGRTAVDTGFDAMRRAGKAGAVATSRAVDAAEHKLAERGIEQGQLVEALSEGADIVRKEVGKTSRRARKKLAKRAKKAQNDMTQTAKKARKAAKKSKPARKAEKAVAGGKKLAKQSKKEAKLAAKEFAKELKAEKKNKDGKKRRRWPWVIGIGAVVAGAAYALNKRQEPAMPEPLPPRKPADAAAPAKETPQAKDTESPQAKPAEAAKHAANGQSSDKQSSAKPTSGEQK
ncbi:hypothetical protein EV191_10382 [Tamaricihabitans halophyticus]|uniref:Uncharacterized protein n=1 Tax=Tamaricihabitans halophyticus TaxID=1262583 RepID=A0A4R2QVG2_9PSEU|nr:hypothetical protein [Tamaricihabitans halophyticus]TCP54042.1 hypothetical protein EV191_10382 [Tamaricihabitans halophyticus]